jgi:hypothetical protein
VRKLPLALASLTMDGDVIETPSRGDSPSPQRRSPHKGRKLEQGKAELVAEP